MSWAGWSQRDMRYTTADELLQALQSNNTPPMVAAHSWVTGAHIVTMSEALGQNTSVTTLKVNGSTISDEAAQTIGWALRLNSSMKMLDMGFSKLGDSGAKAVATGLSFNTTLKGLDLRCCEMHAEGAEEIGRVLQINSTLEELKLSHNSLGDLGVQEIARGLGLNEALKLLDLFGCDFHCFGAQAIGRALEVNCSLEDLNLGRNQIGTVGAGAIADGLANNVGLKRLELSASPSIRAEGVQAIGRSLSINSSLQVLCVVGKENMEDWVLALTEVLRSNSTISTLHIELQREYNIHSNEIVCSIPAIEALGRAIKARPTRGNTVVSLYEGHPMHLPRWDPAQYYDMEEYFLPFRSEDDEPIFLGIQLCRAWRELGLLQECRDWSNHQIISMWANDRAKILAFALGLHPRLGRGGSHGEEGCAFFGLDTDLYQLISELL